MTNLDYSSNDSNGYRDADNMMRLNTIIHPDSILSNLQVSNNYFRSHPVPVQDLSKDVINNRPSIFSDSIISNLQVSNNFFRSHPVPVQDLSKGGINNRPSILPDSILSNFQVSNNYFQSHPVSVQDLSKGGINNRPSILPDSILSNFQVSNNYFQLHSVPVQDLSKGAINNNPSILPDSILSNFQVSNNHFQSHPVPVQDLSKGAINNRPSILPDSASTRVEAQLHSSDHIIHQECASLSLTPLRARATKKRKTNYNNNISTKIGNDDSDSSNKMSNNNNDGNEDNRKRKRSTNTSDRRWNTMLLELTDYEREFKHTNVPNIYTQNKPLGVWVRTQRNQYRLIEEGKPNYLTKERINSLNKIGFVWRIISKFSKVTWEERLQQLIDFNNEFNHTNVTQAYAKNKPLATWVSQQRTQYRQLVEEGKPSPLTKERIESLNKLGFVWRRGKGTRKVTAPVVSSTTMSLLSSSKTVVSSTTISRLSWEERLQQLVDFNNEFNHTNVPSQYTRNKPLGNWVSQQRSLYKLIEEGKPSSLTDERIKSLNKLGFVWRWRIVSKYSQVTWEERLQQLIDFNNEFNHTNVPQTYAKNKPLGTWVSNQRTQYRQLVEEGKLSSLTDERIKSLNKLGFVWRLRDGVKHR